VEWKLALPTDLNRADRFSMSSGKRKEEDFWLDERVDLAAMA